MSEHITLAMAWLKKHEGLRLKPYRCPAGALTIGYGHNLDAKGITLDQAESILVADVQEVISGLSKAIPDIWNTLDDSRRAVLIDMGFNLGIEGLLKFKNMLGLVRSGLYEEAARAMLDSKWASQVGARATFLADKMRGHE